jgi:WXG100 family type VII secretion target
MEVEVARTTQSNMTNTKSQLESNVQTMTSAVQGLVGSAWIGNSANEFQSVYEQWRNSMNQLLTQLQEMSGRLANEINEWEQMAAKLN